MNDFGNFKKCQNFGIYSYNFKMQQIEFPLEVETPDCIYIINSDGTAHLKLYKGMETNYRAQEFIYFKNGQEIYMIPITEILPDAFKLSNVVSFEFPGNSQLEVLHRGSFAHKKDFKVGRTINLPCSLKNIAKFAFEHTPLTRIFVNPDNRYYVHHQGMLYSIGSNAVLFCSRYMTHAFIREGTTTIENCAFEYCKKLKYVVFPKSLKKIGKFSFNQCCKIRSIRIPDTVEEIESYAFAKCKNLRSVVFHNNSKIKEIQVSTFFGCKLIKKVILPPSIIAVRSQAFDKDLIELEFTGNRPVYLNRNAVGEKTKIINLNDVELLGSYFTVV